MQIVYIQWYTSSKNSQTSKEYSRTSTVFLSKFKNDYNARFLIYPFTCVFKCASLFVSKCACVYVAA